MKLTKHKTNYGLFKDRQAVREALIQCLLENDIEAFRDILTVHLKAISKTQLMRETKLGRRTIYDLMDSKKPFNPGIKTLGPILKSLAH